MVSGGLAAAPKDRADLREEFLGPGGFRRWTVLGGLLRWNRFWEGTRGVSRIKSTRRTRLLA
jgi:hypothetical protein